MSLTKLNAEQTRRICDPTILPFETTAELEYTDEIFGHPRALRAMDFGMHMPAKGYNIFVVGSAGTGRMPSVQRYLAKHAPKEPAPSDWVYVHNFADSYRPISLQLPCGTAKTFAQHIDALMTQVRTQLPRVFESGEYDAARDQNEKQFATLVGNIEQGLHTQAKAQHCLLLRTATGYAVAPALRGKPISTSAFNKLTKRVRAQFEKAHTELNEAIEDAARQLREVERQKQTQLETLEKQVARGVVAPLLADVLATVANDNPNVRAWLAAFAEDVVTNVAFFANPQPALATLPAHWFNRYRVNVFVDNGATTGAPVISEDNPIYYNIHGKIEQNASASGMMMTDHMMLRAGALHRANGGFLVMRADRAAENYFAWAATKRCLLRDEIRMEAVSGDSTPTLEPQAIPLKVKVVLWGDSGDYWLGYQDEDFRALFKVKAEFSWQMERVPENEQTYAKFLRARSEEENLLPFDRSAVARLIEHGSRATEDQRKLSVNFGKLADVAREANFWAVRNKRVCVVRDDVQRALDERRFRLSQRQESSTERIQRGVETVQTEGSVVGQINGLWVMDTTEFEFGEPFRISARAFVGRGGINDIDRAASYTDSTHNKGLAIVDSYLTSLYSVEQAFNVTANVAFEHNYSNTAGYSASCAMLCAMLSAVGGLPISQTLAMTGTIDQFGFVQPIGGANAKIEGWFDLLKMRGQIDGTHSVVIPSKNIEDLMLREDIVSAIGEGKFTVYAADHVDDCIEIAMGLPAGKRDEHEKWSEGSVHAKVEAALREINDKLEGNSKRKKQKEEEAAAGSDEKEKDKPTEPTQVPPPPSDVVQPPEPVLPPPATPANPDN